jgi:hypothetical protein
MMSLIGNTLLLNFFFPSFKLYIYIYIYTHTHTKGLYVFLVTYYIYSMVKSVSYCEKTFIYYYVFSYLGRFWKLFFVAK